MGAIGELVCWSCGSFFESSGLFLGSSGSFKELAENGPRPLLGPRLASSPVPRVRLEPLWGGRHEEGREPVGPRPSTRRTGLASMGGGADSPPPLEEGLRGAASPQHGQRYDARHHQRQGY